MEARIDAANGWTDHVHLVTSIPPKIGVATFVKRLKGASSFDLNHADPLTELFNWQCGHSVWTLGESQLQRAIHYVRNQKKHHAQQTLNRWLEQVDAFDDGPPHNVGRPGGPDRIGEETAPYDL